MKIFKVARTPQIQESGDIKIKNELLGEGEYSSPVPGLAPKRTLGNRPQFRRLVGRPLSLVTLPQPWSAEARVRPLPLPSFQISRFVPRPSPRSAHSSAGCAALSPKLFSINSFSSSTCSIPNAETSNCRQVNSGEPGATHRGKTSAKPHGAARMRRPAEVPSDLRGQSLRRSAREALLLLCLRVWKTGSLRNLAQTKCSGFSVSVSVSPPPPSPPSLSLDTPTHVRHTHLV